MFPHAGTLPDLIWSHISLFLSAPDVLSFLQTNKEIFNVSKKTSYWKCLRTSHFRDYESGVSQFKNTDGASTNISAWGVNGDDRDSSQDNNSNQSIAEAKRSYLELSCRQDLLKVQWMPVIDDSSNPNAREGHNSCILGNYFVISGGFSVDEGVYVKDLSQRQGTFHCLKPIIRTCLVSPSTSRTTLRQSRANSGEDFQLSNVYGASLTPISNHQAIRFGGFRSGGYSAESCQVALLTIERVPNSGDEEVKLRAIWDIRKTSCTQAAMDRVLDHYLSRAYHTSTLLFDRYLVILGGMQSSRSIWKPAVLDVATWTWIIPSYYSISEEKMISPRHGHSTVWDGKRSRFVVFGGGTGSDLLRSGEDFAHVWVTTRPITTPNDLLLQIMSEDANVSSWKEIYDDESILSLAESLCLGRCHISHLVAPDTVLLAFGSGRPSTNGVLAYNLAAHTFFRPHVMGPLPSPRFTTTSVLWSSYIVVHGGFCTQQSTAIRELMLLDLAPTLKRPIDAFRLTSFFHQSHESVTDEQVFRIRERNRQREQIQGLHAHHNTNLSQYLSLFFERHRPPRPPVLHHRMIFDAAAEDDDESYFDDNEMNLDSDMEG